MDTHAMHSPDRRRNERRKTMHSAGHEQVHQGAGSASAYGRFAAMLLASTLLGFAATYLNSYQIDHVFFSWTRVFMAMIMGGFMAAVMIVFMWKMYPRTRLNWMVLLVAAGLVAAGLALVRTQGTVGDVAYMKAMIPHHSIAILTSSRARIEDPRVRELADGIIESQKREITEMKRLVAELDDGAR